MSAIPAVAAGGATGADVRASLVVGVLGGSTTFSTSSLDAVTLVQRGHLGIAGRDVVASVALALVGFMLGLGLFWILLS